MVTHLAYVSLCEGERNANDRENCSSHLPTSSQNKRKKHEGSFSQNKKENEQHKESTWFIFKKVRHIKKE